MKWEQFEQGRIIRSDIIWRSQERVRFKKLRKNFVECDNNAKAIQEAFNNFNIYKNESEWAVELRGILATVILDTIDERIEQLDAELVELQKQFEEL